MDACFSTIVVATVVAVAVGKFGAVCVCVESNHQSGSANLGFEQGLVTPCIEYRKTLDLVIGGHRGLFECFWEVKGMTS